MNSFLFEYRINVRSQETIMPRNKAKGRIACLNLRLVRNAIEQRPVIPVDKTDSNAANFSGMSSSSWMLLQKELIVKNANEHEVQ
jgi:hypothetical protein